MLQGVFGACEFGLLFERFSLCPPFEEFQKMADFGVFAKLPLLGIAGTFRAAVCGTMLSDDCTLSAY